MQTLPGWWKMFKCLSAEELYFTCQEAPASRAQQLQNTFNSDVPAIEIHELVAAHVLEKMPPTHYAMS